MTKLIFVHGINNQDKSSEQIIEEWAPPLNEALFKIGLKPFSKKDISAPYYGDFLHEKSNRNFNIFKDDSTRLLSDTENKILGEMNEWVLSDDLEGYVEFENIRAEVGAKLNEPVYMAPSILGGVTEEGEDDKGVAKKMLHRKSSIAIATFLSKNFPGIKGPVADVALRQASVYLENKEVQKGVNNLVYEQAFKERDPKEKVVIVSHSLGTVVSHFMLNDMLKDQKVQALFTLGSPLGTRYLEDFNPKPASFPANIGTWFNCYDKRDFVSLNSPVTQERIGFDGVINSTDFDTSEEDRHWIVSYLLHKNLAQDIRTQFDLII